MSDTNSMANEIIVLKEKLDKTEKENAELKEQIAKLMDKIEANEAEKFQQCNSIQPIASNQSFQEIDEKKSNDLEEKKDEKGKMPRKCIPNWLIEVLAWIKRVEMAYSKLSTSSWTFKQLCWPKLHLNVKPYNIEYNLRFYDEYNEYEGIYHASLYGYKGFDGGIKIPIATIAPPKYITGLKEITINFLDRRVMLFIESIQSKLNGISLSFYDIKNPSGHSMKHVGQIIHLFEMLAKKASTFWHDNLFSGYLLFYPNLFDQIKNTQSILWFRPNEKEFDLFVQWLNKSRVNQEPKILNIFREDKKSIFIDKIKEQFIGSKQSANFIITFQSEEDIFNLENEQTGEILALYLNANQRQNPWDFHDPLQCLARQCQNPWDFDPLECLARQCQKPWDFVSPLQFLVRHPKGKEYLRADWEKQLKKSEFPKITIEITG